MKVFILLNKSAVIPSRVDSVIFDNTIVARYRMNKEGRKETNNCGHLNIMF